MQEQRSSYSAITNCAEQKVVLKLITYSCGLNRGRLPKAHLWSRRRSNSDSGITGYFLQKRKRNQDSSFSDPEDNINFTDTGYANRRPNSGWKLMKERRVFIPASTNTQSDSMEAKLNRILERLDGMESNLQTGINELRNDITGRIKKLEEECEQLRKANGQLLRGEAKRDDLLENHDEMLRERNALIVRLSVDPNNALQDVNKFRSDKFAIQNAVEEARVRHQQSKQEEISGQIPLYFK